jgi:dTDP-glucose 4,6-dehydratase
MAMTILVTGGAGFIGGCFVRRMLSQQRARLINLDKLTYAGNMMSLDAFLDDPAHIFVEGDVQDGSLVRRLLEKHKPDAVVHFAAESHVDRSIIQPADFVDTNVVGTFRLLEAARQYWQQLAAAPRARFRFLHISTDEVYGSLGPSGTFSESTAYAPRSPYAASKASADHFVHVYWHTYGLPTIITRSSNNYGPYQFPEKLIPLSILCAAAGKPVNVYGDGSNVRDWLFVEDHGQALELVLEQGQPGETYNIGGHCERSNLEVVTRIRDLVDELLGGTAGREPASRDRINFVADRPGHDFRYAMDTTRIQREFGWQPRTDFESGLEKTVRWYLANSAWVERMQAQGTS